MKTRKYEDNLHQAGSAIFIDSWGKPKNPSAAQIAHEWRNDRMPYGMWTCEDGRKVLFNRHYEPIYEQLPSGRVQAAHRYEWVPFVKQEWFYDDSTTVRTSIKIGLGVLQKWGLRRP